MKPNPVHRLPAPLEMAVQRLKMAAREAAERTIESLGLAALASTNAFHRDGLLGAQFELNRKSAVFVLTFNDALDERVLRELGPRAVAEAGPPAGGAPPPSAPSTDWATLSLVDDKEVEAQISAERFGMEIAHACEWELRELEGYVGTLLGDAGGERDRNPLRPELVGHAMIRGIESLSDRADIRKVLSSEFGRSLAALLRNTYADIVAELRNAGVQPQGLTVRNRAHRGGAGAEDGDDDGGDPSNFGTGPGGDERVTRAGHGPAGRRDAAHTRSGGFAPSGRSTLHGHGHSFGAVDPALMSLIRRLAYDAAAGSGGGGGGDYGAANPDDAVTGPLPHNVIRAHRDELREASKGKLDHMVIDLIGFLFDQILADSKVPPQMARQIARLQLPVLRAALGDPTFFSSRKHPVRRFINRIASLGAAFDDFGDDAARAWMGKVKALIHEVVEGDFEQIDLYEQKLTALEAFTAELAAGDAAGGPAGAGAAVALLSEKEDQQRLRQLYALRLEGELKDLTAPPFLRDFLSRVWSQALLRATEQGGPEGPLALRLRDAARQLFLSVQPKATPAHRKAFLAELPRLMQDLTEGMNLIAWPEAQRRAFFGQLMPAHAEALKSPAGRQLDINLMARKFDGALQRPPPSRAELKTAPPLPAPAGDAAVSQFSPEEARQVGLVDESAIDWNGQVDVDLSAEPAPPPLPAAALPPGLDLQAGTEPADPTEGRALADHVQIGFAYRMHLDGEWQKVRLAHVSPGRSFFLFTHGSRQRKTVSLTQRMLVRLCDTGRLKAYESSYLVERAADRARRQLAGLSAQPAG